MFPFAPISAAWNIWIHCCAVTLMKIPSSGGNMDDSLLDRLHTFIVRAKQTTYVGSGHKLLPYRLGSHDLQFIEGDWAYHDSYLGENDFIGEEAVYYKTKVAWAENYYGRILMPDKITSAEAGAMIKISLS